MKKFLCLAAVLVFCVSGVFANVEYIQINQVSGASAAYNQSGDNTLTWTGGAGFIYIFTEPSYEFLNFTSSTLTFDFELASSQVVGGEAQGKFNMIGTWQMDLNDTWGSHVDETVFTISGTINTDGSNPFGGQYWEGGPASGPLEGAAWLTLDSTTATVDASWLNQKSAATFLAFHDSTVGLDSYISLDSGQSISDYATGSYTSTDGLTLKIWDAESEVIPEPATMVLLGLGGLLLRRKK